VRKKFIPMFGHVAKILKVKILCLRDIRNSSITNTRLIVRHVRIGCMTTNNNNATLEESLVACR
jgi:hypothetical protein